MSFQSVLGDLSPDILAAAVAIALAGGFVRGFSGFGLALIVVPAMALVVEPRLIVPVAILLQLGGAVQLVRPALPLADWRSIRWLLVGAALATPIGLLIVKAVPADPMRIGIGAVTLAASLTLGIARNFTISARRGPAVGMGILSGLCNGAAGVPGPPVVFYLMARARDPAIGRASLIIYFSILSVFTGTMALISGLFIHETLVLGAVMLPGMFIGTAAGARAFARFGATTYRPVVVVLLALVAVGALLRGILGMLGAV